MKVCHLRRFPTSRLGRISSAETVGEVKKQVAGGKVRCRCRYSWKREVQVQFQVQVAGCRLQVAGCRWKREVQMQFQVEANCDGFVPGDPPLLFFSRNHQLFSLVLEAHR